MQGIGRPSNPYKDSKKPLSPYFPDIGKFMFEAFEAGVSACEATHESIRQEERARITADLTEGKIAIYLTSAARRMLADEIEKGAKE